MVNRKNSHLADGKSLAEVYIVSYLVFEIGALWGVSPERHGREIVLPELTSDGKP